MPNKYIMISMLFLSQNFAATKRMAFIGTRKIVTSITIAISVLHSIRAVRWDCILTLAANVVTILTMWTARE